MVRHPPVPLHWAAHIGLPQSAAQESNLGTPVGGIADLCGRLSLKPAAKSNRVAPLGLITVFGIADRLLPP